MLKNKSCHYYKACKLIVYAVKKHIGNNGSN